MFRFDKAGGRKSSLADYNRPTPRAILASTRVPHALVRYPRYCFVMSHTEQNVRIQALNGEAPNSECASAHSDTELPHPIWVDSK